MSWLSSMCSSVSLPEKRQKRSGVDLEIKESQMDTFESEIAIRRLPATST
jgi:hypothetical protein